MKHNSICILGGSGFVGKQIANRLVSRNRRVRILTRNRNNHRDLLVLPNIELIEADVFDNLQLKKYLNGVDAVINLVGILNEKQHNGDGFRKVHVELPKNLLGICLDLNIRRILHMSALNADANLGTSFYLRTKGEGENTLHTYSTDRLAVTSFRPSVIFGPGDSFLNRFADLLKVMPYFFPLACATARFAPVYVGDVADRFVQALDDKSTYGQRYNVCGPEEYSLKQLVEYTAKTLDLNRRVISLPDFISQLQANVLEWFPGKPFSVDNYNSLKLDSVCQHGEHEATSLAMVVPSYLGDDNRQTDYDAMRRMTRQP
ncbi:MAG: complex I NDUFA9 subunit family protein [Gammaproteobacteria bacterium]|nr:complex I NDUFA9 subunit family protein [Gammaproteobacteria bacterium]NNJ98471.1 complex I NDUFA9 subunit family protein [Gammaproteobacteria bacterium]